MSHAAPSHRGPALGSPSHGLRTFALAASAAIVASAITVAIVDTAPAVSGVETEVPAGTGPGHSFYDKPAVGEATGTAGGSSEAVDDRELSRILRGSGGSATGGSRAPGGGPLP